MVMIHNCDTLQITRIMARLMSGQWSFINSAARMSSNPLHSSTVEAAPLPHNLKQNSAPDSSEVVLSDLLEEAKILYKSENFVVVNKRYDLKVNSDDPSDLFTVSNQLSRLYPNHVDKDAAHGFRFIHRLDYATSGCLCIALSKMASRWGHKAFANRYVTKHYIALVRGHLNPDTQRELDIDVPIGNDASVTDIYRMCTGFETPFNVQQFIPLDSMQINLADNPSSKVENSFNKSNNTILSANSFDEIEQLESNIEDKLKTKRFYDGSNSDDSLINEEVADDHKVFVDKMNHLGMQKQQNSISNCRHEDELSRVVSESIGFEYNGKTSELCVDEICNGSLSGNSSENPMHLTDPNIEEQVQNKESQNSEFSLSEEIKITDSSTICVKPRQARSTLILLQHGSYEGLPVSKVLLIPETGRTHQLRVHCRHIGHPVVGDYMYSERRDVTPYRMMLHSMRLVIPMKKENIDMTAPDPFTQEIDSLWRPMKTFNTYEQYLTVHPIRQHSK